jgi:hypothetical protein
VNSYPAKPASRKRLLRPHTETAWAYNEGVVPRLTWLIVAAAFAFVVCCGRTSGAGKGGGRGGSVGAIAGASGAVVDAAEPDGGLAMGGDEGPFRDAGIADGAEACDDDDAWPTDDGGAGLSGDAAIDRWGADAVDAAGGIDGCRPITCTDSPCHVAYCGLVGDGCGGTLDCGNPCSPQDRCWQGKCLGDDECQVITCELWGSYHYCGAIGTGCLYDLDCGCPTGWTCENNFCVGRPPVCSPKTCADFLGCGWHDDGCGSAIECLDCPTPGWRCNPETGTCYASPPICTPSTSCASSAGDVYCETIGDGCGGALQCGDPCTSLGTRCEHGVCGGGPSMPPVAPPTPPKPRTDPPPPPPPWCGPPMPPA